MSPRIALLACAGLVAVLPAAAHAKGPLPEPDDGPDPRGLTVTGIGAAAVAAPSRRSEATIERALDAARPVALARALRDARARGGQLAAAAGLTLGPRVAVTQRDRDLEQGYVAAGRHCWRDRRTGRQRCSVPGTIDVTVAVTFTTAETSAAVAQGRALTASGIASAMVRPDDRRSSPSIGRALREARAATLAPALGAARAAAATVAFSTGLPLGALFSVAEVRRPYEEFSTGGFGLGRYCGFVRRAILRRDARTGRQRVVRRVRRRACYFSSRVTAGLRVTYLPALSGG